MKHGIKSQEQLIEASVLPEPGIIMKVYLAATLLICLAIESYGLNACYEVQSCTTCLRHESCTFGLGEYNGDTSFRCFPEEYEEHLVSTITKVSQCDEKDDEDVVIGRHHKATYGNGTEAAKSASISLGEVLSHPWVLTGLVFLWILSIACAVCVTAVVWSLKDGVGDDSGDEGPSSVAVDGKKQKERIKSPPKCLEKASQVQTL